MSFKNSADILLKIKDIGDVYAKIVNITDMFVYLKDVSIEKLAPATFPEITISRSNIICSLPVSKPFMTLLSLDELIRLQGTESFRIEATKEIALRQSIKMKCQDVIKEKSEKSIVVKSSKQKVSKPTVSSVSTVSKSTKSTVSSKKSSSLKDFNQFEANKGLIDDQLEFDINEYSIPIDRNEVGYAEKFKAAQKIASEITNSHKSDKHRSNSKIIDDRRYSTVSDTSCWEKPHDIISNSKRVSPRKSEVKSNADEKKLENTKLHSKEELKQTKNVISTKHQQTKEVLSKQTKEVSSKPISKDIISSSHKDIISNSKRVSPRKSEVKSNAEEKKLENTKLQSKEELKQTKNVISTKHQQTKEVLSKQTKEVSSKPISHKDITSSSHKDIISSKPIAASKPIVSSKPISSKEDSKHQYKDEIKHQIYIDLKDDVKQIKDDAKQNILIAEDKKEKPENKEKNPENKEKNLENKEINKQIKKVIVEDLEGKRLNDLQNECRKDQEEGKSLDWSKVIQIANGNKKREEALNQKLKPKVNLISEPKVIVENPVITKIVNDDKLGKKQYNNKYDKNYEIKYYDDIKKNNYSNNYNNYNRNNSNDNNRYTYSDKKKNNKNYESPTKHQQSSSRITFANSLKFGHVSDCISTIKSKYTNSDAVTSWGKGIPNAKIIDGFKKDRIELRTPSQSNTNYASKRNSDDKKTSPIRKNYTSGSKKMNN